MRYCPSTGTTCYAEVCKAWPCDTPEQKAALEAEGAARLVPLQQDRPKAEFEIPDGE